MARKLPVYPKEHPLPLLPPVTELLDAMDLMPRNVIRWFAVACKLSPPVSERTIREAFSKGIASEKTLRKLKEFLLSSVQPDPELRSGIRQTLASSLKKWSDIGYINNGSSWEPLCEALGVHACHLDNFIRSKCSDEREILKKVKEYRIENNITQDNISPTDVRAICDIYADYIEADSAIPDHIIKDGIESVKAWGTKACQTRDDDSPSLRTEKKLTPEVSRLILYLKMDFYHRLMASLSLDIIIFLKDEGQADHLQNQLIEYGFFADMAPDWSQRRYWTPINSLIMHWKKTQRDAHGNALSLKKISEAMGGPYGLRRDKWGKHEETILAGRKALLSKWRAGTVRPEKANIEALSTNLANTSLDPFFAEQRIKAAVIWTELIKGLKSDNLLDLQPGDLETATSTFPSYWERYKDQAARLLAT